MHIPIAAVLALSLASPGLAAQPQGENPLAARAQDPVAGKYAGDGLVLELRAEGGAYVGTLEFQGQGYPCRATASGTQLSGSFEVGGQPFDFQGELAGDRLTLESGGSTYNLQREAPANPLGGGPAVATPDATDAGGGAALGSLDDLTSLERREDPAREWTILVYLDGDNNLEPFALSDLNELEAGLPRAGVEVVVLCDRAEGFDDSDGDWTDARLIRIESDSTPGRVVSEVLARPGELNLGDPATLESFVGGALRAYPAPRTALVMWNHGGGWSVLATDDAAPGSESGHDALTITETSRAIRAGLDAAGVEKLDLIGFDMCLMAQLETAVEVEDVARVMVASQAIEPGDGWPYAAVLAQFGKETLGTTRIASEIVAAYASFYGERGDLLSTQSALDLAHVGSVVGALDDLLGEIDPSAAAQWPKVSRSLFFAESYADMTDIRNGPNALASADLLDVMRRIRNNVPGFAAEKEFRGFVEAMDRFVLASQTSLLRFRSNGVAVYAPVRSNLVNPDYLETRFAQESAWPGWLERLHAAQAANSEAPQIGNFRLLLNDTDEPMDAVTPLGGVSVHFTLTGSNILWTQALSGVWDEESRGVVVFNKWLVVDPEFFVKVYTGEKEVGSDALQLITPEYVDGRNELFQELQGLRYAVSNGEDGFYATIDRSDLNDRQHFHVPVVVEHPSIGRYGGTVYFDVRTWEAVAVLLEVEQPDGSMAYQQLTEVPPDAQVTTLFEFVGEDGSFEYQSGGTLSWGEGLELILGRDDPGTYAVAFTAETVAGDSTTEIFSYQLEQPQEELEIIERGSQFNPADLVGTWAWVGTPKGKTKPEPFGLVTKLELHPENPELLIAETTSTEDENVHEVALVIPDTRMMPNIRFLTLSGEGEISGVNLYSALYMVTDGVAFFTLKAADTGRLYGLVRQGGAAANPAVAGQPTPAAAQQAVDPLVGVWQDEEGTLFGFDGTNWEMGYGGQVVDAGTYTQKGSRITLTSSQSGESLSFKVRINGKRMTATDDWGESSSLTKIQ